MEALFLFFFFSEIAASSYESSFDNQRSTPILENDTIERVDMSISSMEEGQIHDVINVPEILDEEIHHYDLLDEYDTVDAHFDVDTSLDLPITESIEVQDHDNDEEGDDYDADAFFLQNKGGKNIDEPIYDGAPISIFESMMSIMALAMQNKLTGVCVAGILKLISLHLPQPNNFKASVHHLQSCLSISNLPMNIYFYCSICLEKLESRKSKCSKEEEHASNDQRSSFIEIPLLLQLKKLFQRPAFFSNLQYRFKRDNNGCNISDIYDGDLYKKYFIDDGFLSKTDNISLMWYTDGVPIFTSSNISMWPLYLSVNELPPELRYQRENMLLSGIWVGRKPVPNMFLEPLVEPLKQLYKGFQVIPNGEETVHNIRAMLLCGTADLPAKSLMTGTTQFNGAYGCHHCEQKGENFTISPRSHVWVYPYKKEIKWRTHESIEDLMELKRRDEKNVNYMGVQEPSLLFKIMPDAIRGIGFDVMHSLFIGVCKKLFNLWFFTGDKELYSISKYADLIDDKLRNIHLPAYIKRRTRPTSLMKHWKAAEYKNFFLYTSLPCLVGILPIEYLENYVDLLYTIYTLSKRCITLNEINSCEKRIKKFVEIFQKLYGLRHMSMNIHLLLHIVPVVRNLGPMWVHSCFRFEDLNGRILQLVHGTRFADMQIVKNVMIFWQLPELAKSISSTPVKEFCESSFHPQRRLRFEEVTTEGYVVGRYTYVSGANMQEEVQFAFLAQGIPVPQHYLQFQKFKQGYSLFVTNSYCKKFMFSNSYVNFTNNDENGIIESFLRVSECGCESNCRCLPAKFYCFVRKIHTANFYSGISHIKTIEITNDYELVEVKYLKSILINMNHEFVCERVNDIEVE